MIPHLTDAKTGKIKCLSRQAVSVYYNSEKRGKESFLQRDKEKKRKREDFFTKRKREKERVFYKEEKRKKGVFYKEINRKRGFFTKR